VKSGALAVTWKDGGKAFEYRHDGKQFHHDLVTGKVDVKPAPTDGKDNPGPPGKRPGAGRVPPRGEKGGGPPPLSLVPRGRQSDSAMSPDGTLRAFYKDRNLWLSDAKGLLQMPITTDGNEKTRIKNGIASWVYGEELYQRTAMWWSPDSTKIAYYRFDE